LIIVPVAIASHEIALTFEQEAQLLGGLAFRFVVLTLG
jgi:hypothetical protein